MLVAIVPLWVVLLWFAVNAICEVVQVTEEKTDWRQQRPLEDMQKRMDAALVPGSADLDPLLERLAASVQP